MRSAIKNIIKLIIPRSYIPVKYLEEPPIYGRPDSKDIKMFKNIHLGKRCFILGNGPSLNQVDFSLLEDEITFGFNGLFYMTDINGFSPSYYMVEDKAVIKDNLIRINDYNVGVSFFPTHYKDVLKKKDNRHFFKLNVGFYRNESPFFEQPRFSKDFSERAYAGQSVTMIALQLAYYMGFTEVYLLGMDFDYKIPDDARIDGDEIISSSNDLNHFHPDYFGKGKTWHDPKLNNVLASYRHHQLIYEHDHRKILNATKGGKLEVFERVNFDDIFKKQA